MLSQKFENKNRCEIWVNVALNHPTNVKGCYVFTRKFNSAFGLRAAFAKLLAFLPFLQFTIRIYQSNKYAM